MAKHRDGHSLAGSMFFIRKIRWKDRFAAAMCIAVMEEGFKEMAQGESRVMEKPRTGIAHRVLALLPGLGLTAAISALAFLLRGIPGMSLLSPMILAILLGMALHNSVGTPTWAKTGVIFSLRRVLRIGIILLGFQLMLAQIAQIGLVGVGIIAATMLATFAFTRWVGQAMGVDRALVDLIGAGTSICGASAVIAVNIVTQGSDEDVAYAVACVTVFGTLAMFLYPLLPGILHLDPRAFGLWSGSSIHEIAQVVAAAFQDGTLAGDFATVSKLTRVMMLAPLVIALGVAGARRATRPADGHRTGAAPMPPMPWFVLGFLAVMFFNSTVHVPQVIKSAIASTATFLLSMALAAMGLETDFGKLKAEGLKPLGLAAAAALFISLFSLALIKLIAYS